MATDTPQNQPNFDGLRVVPIDQDPTYDESKQQANPKNIQYQEPLQLKPSTNQTLPSAVQPLPTPKDIGKTTVEGINQTLQGAGGLMGADAGTTVQQDIHNVVSGAVKAGTVPMMFAAAVDPMLLAQGVAESQAGGYVAKKGAQLAGASPENQQLAEDIGSVVAPTAVHGFMPARPEGSAFNANPEAGALKVGTETKVEPEVKGDPFEGLRTVEEPTTVFRARPQEHADTEAGIPVTQGSHAHATASESEANGYRQNLEEMNGKPHRVDKIDLTKIPADQYKVMKGPNGHDWVRFNQDQPESIFTKTEEKPFQPAKPKERTTGDADLDARIKEAGGTPGGMQKGFDYKDKETGEAKHYPDMAYVHHDSGSTLNFPMDASKEDIKAGLDNKTAEYGAANVVKDAQQIGGPTKFELSPSNGRVEIKSIETPKDERGKGYASQTLDKLTNLADKHGVELELNANPFETGENRLNIDQLKSLYRKYGFEEKFAKGEENSAKETDRDPEYGYMIRSPKAGLDNKTAEYAAAAKKNEPQTISTRVPTAKNAPENALSHDLKVDSKLATPELTEKYANLVKDYPGMNIDKKTAKDPQAVVDQFVGHIKDNLKWLYNQSTPEEQQANSGWYEGAHNLTKDMSDKYGVPHRGTAGMAASLSPQKDWDMNVSLAKRVADVHFNHGDDIATPEMIAKGNDIVKKTKGNETLAGLIPKLEGKSYNQLTEPVEKAAWLRLYDEAHNPRQFEKINPDGSPGELRTTKKGEPAKVAWGSLNEISKASSILHDPSKDNISNLLGGQHKVRSFYNNIIEPNSPRGDTTIDTHAVAAGLLRPLSGNSIEVTHNFSGPGHAQTGLSGTYPLYQRAYAEAAKELDIDHPRMLQSVVWEKVRKLFPSTFKNEANNAAIDKIWSEHGKGKITADEARQQILDFAQGRSSGVSEKAGSTVDKGKLPSTGVSRGQTAAGRRNSREFTEGIEGLGKKKKK
jgi:hypothetical protein